MSRSRCCTSQRRRRISVQTESEKNRLYYEKNKERLLASKHARSTPEQRATRNSRRRAVTVEKRNCLLFDKWGLSASGKTRVWGVLSSRCTSPRGTAINTLGTIKWYAP